MYLVRILVLGDTAYELHVDTSIAAVRGRALPPLRPALLALLRRVTLLP